MVKTVAVPGMVPPLSGHFDKCQRQRCVRRCRLIAGKRGSGGTGQQKLPTLPLRHFSLFIRYIRRPRRNSNIRLEEIADFARCLDELIKGLPGHQDSGLLTVQSLMSEWITINRRQTILFGCDYSPMKNTESQKMFLDRLKTGRASLNKPRSRLQKPRRSKPAVSTLMGHTNDFEQTVLRGTGLKAPTGGNQYVYVMRCGLCGNIYGCSGWHIHKQHCPACQDGTPGLKYREDQLQR